MTLSQHSTSPSPALVIRTSVLQTSQRNLLPNKFGILLKAPFLILGLFLHGLLATNHLAGAGASNNELRAALGAAISFAHLVGHICTTFQNAITRYYNFDSKVLSTFLMLLDALESGCYHHLGWFGVADIDELCREAAGCIPKQQEPALRGA